MACDINEPICQVRYKVGDVDEPFEIVDEVYQLLLDQNNNNILLTAIEICKLLKAKYASLMHERVENEEIWGDQLFDQYCKLLKDLEVEKSKDLGKVGERSGIYAGGTRNDDMYNNDSNPNNRRPTIKQFYTKKAYEVVDGSDG